MATNADGNEEFCQRCSLVFPTWEALCSHKLNSRKHNPCIYCYREFVTNEAKRRHMLQDHANTQSLTCVGCGRNFPRAASYISHLELEQCPVIHKSIFNKRRNEQEKWHNTAKSTKNNVLEPNAVKPTSVATQAALVVKDKTITRVKNSSWKLPGDVVTDEEVDTEVDGDLLAFDDVPRKSSWGHAGEDEVFPPASSAYAFTTQPKSEISSQSITLPGKSPNVIADKPAQDDQPRWGIYNDYVTAAPSIIPQSLTGPDKVYPQLPTQAFKHGDSKVADLLTGDPVPFPQASSAWTDEKPLFPEAPKAIAPPQQLLESLAIGPPQKHVWHKHDPDDPNFNPEIYYNRINEKYRCAWPGCKKLLTSAIGLRQHLKSAAHMDLKLRCPGCLRQFTSATALVSHGESQAIKCQIRNSAEYRQALDMISGGFLDTKGQHTDKTVRYVAPAENIPVVKGGFGNHLAKVNADYQAKYEKDLERKQKEPTW